jgi:hypothetical protein
LHNLNVNATLRDCTFVGNHATNSAGTGLFNFDSTASLTNCLFVNNGAWIRGGGIANYGASNLTLANCTLNGNGYVRGTSSIPAEGGAIYNANGAAMTLANCILWGDAADTGAEIFNSGGTVSSNFSDVQGGLAGAGNIQLDPQFVAGANGATGYVGNQRLKLTSPCIDVGNNAAVPAGVIQDLAGANRLIDIPAVHDPGLVVDMGAYERVPGTLSVSTKLFLFDTFKPMLQFQFNSNIDERSLEIDDLILSNFTTGEVWAPSRWGTFAYDARTRVATWTFTTPLPDGNYESRLPMDRVSDPLGYWLESDETHAFFVLAGDANRDRVVNLQDFNILASNFGQSNRTFSQGDFNYDSVVNLLDFNILASRFGMALAPGALSGMSIALNGKSSRLIDALRDELLA